jgi:hypothetical protein
MTIMKLISKLSRILVLIIAGAYTSPDGSRAQEDKPFTITYDSPPKGMERLLGSAWWIYLDGEIDGRAGARLEQFVKSNDVPIRSLVILNSGGGSVYGGMELGRVIRKYGFETDVGIRDKKSKDRSYLPGECYSSCAYAYLVGREELDYAHAG